MRKPQWPNREQVKVPNYYSADHFAGGENMGLFFDSDMVNPLLKTNARRGRFNFVIFVIWSAVNVGRWLVVAWGGNSSFSLTFEISPLVFLILFTEETQGEFRVSYLGGLLSKRCCDHKGWGAL